MRRVGWRIAPLVVPLIAGAVLGGPGCGQESEAQAPTDAAAAEDPTSGGTGASVVSISGPGGITSPTLAAGTFIGAGGHVEPGQELATPKGTLAQLQLDGGGTFAMNEDTRLALPGGDHPDAIALQRGELVVRAGKPGDRAVHVVGGGDDLAVESGEVQVEAKGDARRYAVVHGRARLTTGDQTVALGAGESLQTPLPPEKKQPEPTLSLRPIEDTGWVRTFDAAAAMADAVPRGVGSLTARRAGTQKERQALRLTDHTVTVNISGRVAHTEIEQAFFNDRGQVLEGIYRFPIPEDGSVSGLSLLVGNTWMDGEILEKQRARAIFQQIVDATVPRDPALLEWERGNVFKLRIFPIPGNGERKVKLSYTQVLPVVGGKLRYRYPMGGTGAAGTPIDRFAFTVRIDGEEVATEQRENITTPMLALERRDAGEVIELHTEREAFLPTFDLGVDVPVPPAEQQVHARSFLDKDGQAYFMVAMQPQFEMGIDERPVDYAFVLDRSHSTSPELWTTARGVVDAMTELMDADDRFTVLACDSACDQHTDGMQAPTSDAVDRAQRFLDAQDLAGASDLAGSLQQASDALDGGRDAQRVVVYLGDGVPTSGEMAPDGITDLLAAPLSDTRVLAVALGARSDITALQAVVDVTGGDLVQADARDDLRALVRELRLRAEVPALRDAQLDLPAGMVMARMQNVSAVRPGDTVLVTGKLHHRVSGDIVLRGRGPGGAVSASFPIDLSAGPSSSSPVDAHLPRTWAKMQIQHLTKTKGFRARDEIVALSKDYTVLSRHTAMLVLENDAMFREFNVVRKAKETSAWDGGFKAAGNTPEVSEKALEETARSSLSGKKDAKPQAEASDAPSGSAGLDKKEDFAKGRLHQEAREEQRNQQEGGEVIGGVISPSTTVPSEAEPEPELEPDPSAAAERERNLDEAPPTDVLEDEDAEDDAFGDVGTRGTGRGGGGKAPRTEPPAAPKKSEKKKRASSKRPAPSQKPVPIDGNDDGWGNAASGSSSSQPWSRDQRSPDRRRKSRWSPPPPQLRIRTFPAPRNTGRIERLAAAVEQDPTNRAAHSKLVRTAIANGDGRMLAFAQAWANVDPDHAGALEALADALAHQGDPIALRAYESVVEVKPFSAREHRSLARAFENKGDLARACSHRRALVSIDPDVVEHQAGLIACLQRAGRQDDARDVEALFLGGPTERAVTRSKRVAALNRAVSSHMLSVSKRGQLRATLTWSGPDDLDIAVIDRSGRRLSTLHDRGKLKAVEGRGREELSMSKVRRSVFVEVSRAAGDGGATAAPVSATLELVTPNGRKRIPVTISAGSTRAAKVFWSR
ncbi:MAG: VIT domain-containing protein [Myxococcota bacterium]